MTHPNIQTIVDTSTGHLRKNDYVLLDRYVTDESPEDVPFDSSKSLIAYNFGYGWTVSTSGAIGPNNEREARIEAMRQEGFSEEFIRVFEFACDNDAVMVRFDRDGEPIPEFPTFDAFTDECLDDDVPAPSL